MTPDDHDETNVAEAVAGAEPERDERDTSGSWASIRPSELKADAEADDADAETDSPGLEDDGSVSAAALMGGSDSEYAADAEDEHDQEHAQHADAGGVARTRSLLPLEQLDALDHADRQRLARQRGLDWPTTDEARDRLEDTIKRVIRHEDARVVDAPTALGKSHTVASTRWGAFDDVTGGQPVVHLSETRDARDEAIATAEAEGGEYFVLRSRDEACPLAGGRHDPEVVDAVDEERQVITMDGQPASEWIHTMCVGRGVPFSVVHRRLSEYNDQGADPPCCADGECDAIAQWDDFREGEWPLVIATHQFAHVPGLRQDKNVVFDEQVDFSQDFGADDPSGVTARVRSAVGAFLEAADAPVQSYEQFVSLARYGGYGDDAGREREALEAALNYEPDREWYFDEPRAHTMAPALARAIFHAGERANGRLCGTERYEPPRLDAGARDADTWNHEWLKVVLDEDDTVRTVRSSPDLAGARSVVGLDAHPSIPVWSANTLPYIERTRVLEPEERQLWRRFERGLRVVQVGEATRPLASGEYFDEKGFRALAEHLREQYGDAWSTMLTTNAVEDRATRVMENAGVSTPETMHFGEERSRNDFAGEPVGLVEGCIDPGDDYVLDLLAELDLDAEPERSDAECDECDGDGCRACDGTGHKRAHGRGWTGEDAETAKEILASVRENHTAQAAGRYARDPDDPEDTATVFVRTDAAPPAFADVQVPGVFWTYAPKQTDVVETLREYDEPVPARRIAHDADVSKQHVHDTLERLVEEGHVDAVDGIGKHGATLYADAGVPNTGVVDLEEADATTPTTTTFRRTHTWLLTVSDPTTQGDVSSAGRSPIEAEQRAVREWSDGVEGGG